ncbi:hypothetical protein ABK040_010993 [Willaertia magna]
MQLKVSLLLSTTLLFILLLEVINNNYLFINCQLQQSFKIDFNQKPTHFPHFWYNSVGSGNAALCLRSNWRDQLLKAKNELGFQGIRFHGIFDDDMSVVLEGDNSKLIYSFFNIFDCYDFLVKNEIHPIVEIGFMPELLAQNATKTVFHYKGIITPPKDYNQWDDLVFNFGKALIERYGIDEIKKWRFEVWNEPNMQNGFFAGTQLQYFELYEHTARALKRANNNIRVGGPVTASGWIDNWIPQFIKYMTNKNVPFDFISLHEYPTDVTPLRRNYLFEAVKETRKLVGNSIDLCYTEWNAGLENGGGSHFYHDGPYPAPYIVKALFEVQPYVNVFSYWTFTDIFEEGGQQSPPFSKTYGLMTNIGVRKASWKAFELMHQSGDLRFNVQTINEVKNSSIDVYSTLNSKNGEFMIFVLNYQVPTLPQYPFRVNIQLTNVSNIKNCNLRTIDETHANAFNEWQKMGSPTYPNSEQWKRLDDSSKLMTTGININSDESFDIYSTIPSLNVITCILQ